MTFIESLPCTKHSANHFVCLVSFKLHIGECVIIILIGEDRETQW